MFAASTRHNSDVNRIIDNRKYIEEEMEGVTCIYIKARSYIGNGKQRIFNMLDYAKGLLSVSKKFDKEKPDIIYASSVHPLTWLSGYILSKRYKAKFIAETRDLWPETLVAMGQIKKNSIPAKILYKLEKFIYKKADRLIFTFPGGKDYVSNIGLDNSKVRYINNGIDIEEFNYNKGNYTYIDKDLEDNNIFKVIYTGSMGQANELGYLIKTAKLMQEKEIRNIKLILFGDGYQRKELEDYAKENKLDNITFKGRVGKKHIPYILSKSNLNIIVGKDSVLEKYGFSQNKIFDYLASGKPTISNRSVHSILDDNKCGVTVSNGSIEAIVTGILRIYKMQYAEYNQYCKNALKVVHDFDFKVLTDKLEDIILELLTKEEAHANTTN